MRGFRGSSPRVGRGHHAALSLIRCLGCTGHALSGVVNLRSELSDARLQFDFLCDLLPRRVDNPVVAAPNQREIQTQASNYSHSI